MVYKSNIPEITLKLKKGETLKRQIKSSKDAEEIFRQIWDIDSLPIYESFIVIFLNRSNGTIGWIKLSQGGISGTVTDVRLILSTALKCLASGMIVCHNHPSGNLNPSESDNKITLKIKEGGNLLDIQLLDHIILTEDEYYSFADNGII
ncbi:MAG: JAB domain-containing protein [Mobilitalea sp.]